MLEFRNVSLSEWVMAAMMAALGIVAFVASFDLPPPALEPIGPAAFPRATSILLLLLTVQIVISAARKAGPPRPDVSYRRRPDLLIAMALITVAYVALMQFEWLGFRYSTCLYIFVLTMILFGLKVRYLLPSALIAIILGVGLHWLFTAVLFVDLP